MKQFLESFFGLIATYLIAFLSPIGAWLILVGGIVMADFITGILKAHKNGVEINSGTMFRTIPKFIVYGISVLIAHGLSIMFFPTFQAVQLISGFIVFIELKSIDENIHAITGQSLFKQLIDKLNPKK